MGEEWRSECARCDYKSPWTSNDEADVLMLRYLMDQHPEVDITGVRLAHSQTKWDD